MVLELQGLLQGIKKRFGVDLRTLALFRVGLAGLLLSDLLTRSGDLAAFHSDLGVLPTTAFGGALFASGRFSLHVLNGSVFYAATLFVIAGLFALALLIGYRTRFVTIISWILLVSLQNRNPVLLQGGDNLLVLLLFWSMFLPLGARWSVDAALAEDRNQKDNRYFSIATVALLVQCMSVYFFSAFLKSDPAWVPLGSATFMALQLDHMTMPIGQWLRQFPLLTQGLTYFVWYLELLGPILMFAPWFFLPLRLAMQVFFMAMHVGFLLCLKIGYFPFVSLVSLIAFTPTWLWDRLASRLATPRRRGLRIFYDQECDFCRKTCLLLRTFLMLPAVPVEPAQSDPSKYALLEKYDSWVVEDHQGQPHMRWAALAFLIECSPLFWPLGKLMSRSWILRPGDHIYSLIARSRGRLSKLSMHVLPYGEVRTGLSPVASFGVAILAAVVLIINVTSLEQLGLDTPWRVQQIRTTLRLDQKWDMFAPYPLTSSVWYLMSGRTKDGSEVDAWNLRSKVSLDGFSLGPGIGYANERWRKYLHRLQQPDREKYLGFFADFLCRRWEQAAATEDTLQSVQVYVTRVHNKLAWVSARTFLLEKVPERMLLYEKECEPRHDNGS